MGNSFLDHIAAALVQQDKVQPENVCIVLPSKRSGVFLQQAIANQISGPVWLPEITSMDTFVEQLSGLSPTDPLTLAFELYIVYREYKGENAEPFEQAMSWIPTVIADFSDIDMALAKPKAFFSHLSDAKKLEEWNPDGSAPSDIQKNYLQFWEDLGTLYEAYNDKLDQLGITYRGKLFKHASQSNISESQYFSQFETVWFCGLNALTKAEESIIKTIKKEGKARIFWDADTYFVDAPHHEAGRFLIKNLQHFNDEKNWVFDNYAKNPKNISIIGSAGKVGQAKLAQHILQTEIDKYANVAIILADEQMLDPMMAALPQDVGSVNVTLGYPLQYQPVKSWIKDYLAIFSNRDRYYGGAVYHDDLVRFLQHPISREVLDQDCVKQIQDEIIKTNLNYIREKRLRSLLGELNWILIGTDSGSQEMLQKHLQIIDVAFQKIGHSENTPLYKASLTACAKAVKTAAHYLTHYPDLIDTGMLASIFDRMLNQEQISFVGEPLSGLQIMGMLETRALDFQKIILLGANEGVLPKGKSAGSFIPNDLKFDYGIPRYDDKDSIFAYHFYRLLSRCEQAWLVYNTQPEDYGSSEMSRFLTQLKYEHPSNINLTEKIYQNSPEKQAHPVEIKTDELLQSKIEDVVAKRISASAINTFLSCPLDFYYKYILRLKEEDKVEEDVEHSSFGTILHDTLHMIYQPFLGKDLTESGLLASIKDIPQLVEEAFKNEMKAADIKKGVNLISRHVIEDYVKRFIRLDAAELKHTPKKILGLEKEVTRDLPIKGNLAANLYGLIDRIEERPDGIYIIDYKSGAVDSSHVSAKEFDTMFNGNKPKALQLLFYGLICEPLFPGKRIKMGNYSFQRMSDGLILQKSDSHVYFDEQGADRIQEKFSEIIGNIIVNENWTHNAKAKFCNYCDM